MDDERDEPRWAKAAAERRENGGLGLPAGWNPSRRTRIALLLAFALFLIARAVGVGGTPPDWFFGIVGAVVLAYFFTRPRQPR